MDDWSTFYILDDANNPIPVSLTTWSTWFGRFPNRRVALTQVGDFQISTVFLGINHRFCAGPGLPPLVFESMVFDHSEEGTQYIAMATGLHPFYEDREQLRYCTWDEAMKGHQDLVEKYEILTGEVGVPIVDECESTPEQPS